MLVAGTLAVGAAQAQDATSMAMQAKDSGMSLRVRVMAFDLEDMPRGLVSKTI
jgi:hypothetical protein